MGKLEELEERLRRLELSQGAAMGTRRSVGEDMDFMGEVNINAANKTSTVELTIASATR